MADQSVLAKRILSLNLTFAAVSHRIEGVTAGRLRPDPSLVWRWAMGHTHPTDVYLAALAAALDLDESLLREDFGRLRKARATAEKILVVSPERGLSVYSQLKAVRDQVNRRSLLKATAALAAAGAVSPLSPEVQRLAEITGRSEVSDGSIEAVGILADHFSSNYASYDLKEVVRQLSPYLSKVADALSGPLRLRQRAELCRRGAQLSGLLGRTARSLGNLSEARLHFSNGFSLAAEIEDHDLMAWIVLDEATMMSQAGSPQEALELSAAALPISKGSNVVQALSLVARSEALLGRRAEAIKAIDQTERSIGQIRPDENSDHRNVVFNGWAPSATLHAVGRAWLWLGQPKQAEESGVAATAAADSATSMWKAQNRAQGQLVIAGARAQQGEPSGAVQLMREVLSERHHAAYILITQTTDVLSYLKPYAEDDDVQDFMGSLAKFTLTQA